VPVELGDRSYEVTLGVDILGEVCRSGWKNLLGGRQVLVVSDRNVWGFHGSALLAAANACGPSSIAVHVMEPGEEHKNLATLSGVWDALVASGLERGGLVVAFGGGVVGDVAGFAAATYLRGVEFVQVPTTLLAMVDSSVGGKTGIDHPRGKNLLGAFHQPRAVVADIALLRTLPKREVLSGLAEVVKAAVLADEELFRRLEEHGAGIVRDEAALEEVVARAVEIKARIVGSDERESGPRALLNLGHTYGHAVEVVSGYGCYTHGEAVAMGMRFAGELSRRMGHLEQAALDRMEALLTALGYPEKPQGVSAQAVGEALRHDKKSAAGAPRWVLPQRIGQAQWGVVVPPEILEPLLRESERT
jgi:3-dehydroquinate synthase